VILQDDINGEVQIPDGITNIQAFRRWATSDDFPRRGRFSFLCGTLYVDMSMEQLFTHNQLKANISYILYQLVSNLALGYIFTDGTLLSNPKASLSTEPDCTFVSYDAVRSKRVRFTKGQESGFVELVGSPEMTLEVVSDSSVRKDCEILRELYWKAKIPEYWLVDARKKEVHFELLCWTTAGYKPAGRQPGGWLASPVFGRSFRLKQKIDPLGNPEYSLEVRK
jgi:Uma2 family endonuclease